MHSFEYLIGVAIMAELNATTIATIMKICFESIAFAFSLFNIINFHWALQIKILSFLKALCPPSK